VNSSKLRLNRRETMLSLLAVASTGLVSCKDSAGDIKKNVGGFQLGDPFLNSSEMALLTSIAGLIIPTTDTPGAVEAGVQDTIQDLLSNWGEDNVRSYWRGGLKSIGQHFGEEQVFADLSAEKQTELLSALDKGVYKGKIDLPFYKDLKRAVSGAYYMSEVGATQELAYDPVPGDFKGCIEFSEVGKAWAT